MTDPWIDVDFDEELTGDHGVWVSSASYDSSYETERVVAFVEEADVADPDRTGHSPE